MRRLLLTSLLLGSQAAWADPFMECPSRAYLTQGAVANTYSVNLVTGDYALAQDDMDTKSKVNATGFNPNDQFMVSGLADKHRARKAVATEGGIGVVRQPFVKIFTIVLIQ